MDRMIKLCAVDDIRSVVDMIATKIPWGEHGIEFVGSAMNGEDGLELIAREKPDLVLTDIRMPRMDGLEMTERILEVLPNCKIIILSAYTDFEYARQALRVGAYDFVKKPFAIADIVGVTLRAKAAWEEEEQERRRMSQLEARMKESLPALRQEFLSLLIQHPVREAERGERWAFLRLPPLRPPLAVMAIEIDRFAERYSELPIPQVELIRFSLQNIVEETISERGAGVVFREGLHRFVCFVSVPEGESALSIADACCLNISRYTKFTISIGIGREADFELLPVSYRQALDALSYHFYTEGNGAFSCENTSWGRSLGAIDTTERENAFLFAFRSGNLPQSLSLLEELVQEISGPAALPDPREVELLFQSLALRMQRVLLAKFPAEEAAAFDALLQARRADAADLQEYRVWLRRLCEIGVRMIEGERASESQKVIYRSMAMIRSGLGEELTLERCARHANLSVGYYSNLFKKVAGQTFQQFVTHARIERAKEMLIEDYQVQEIAEALGYEHRRYFSEVFKKTTGQTPTEFKEASLGQPPASC